MNEEKRLQRTEQREPSELARRWPSRDGLRQSQRRQRLMDKGGTLDVDNIAGGYHAYIF